MPDLFSVSKKAVDGRDRRGHDAVCSPDRAKRNPEPAMGFAPFNPSCGSSLHSPFRSTNFHIADFSYSTPLQ
jgi:hypothetical protein